mmetsp:Transcript_43763/g.102123  ORF Transcript_43763/g.102123 Transcript_43763/m.102123 type:complete len:133 (+) Transcript_43763:55-453(+)
MANSCGPEDTQAGELAPRSEAGVMSRLLLAKGRWQVKTVKRGWATLAPSLQEALTEAMLQTKDRVEIRIDPATSRAWVPDGLEILETEATPSFLAYEAYPLDRTVGKVHLRCWRGATKTDSLAGRCRPAKPS